MKIERVAFEEIPNEIQEQAKEKFRDGTEILEVMYTITSAAIKNTL